MVSWKAAAIAAPFALAGVWAIAGSTRELGRLEEDFRRQGEASAAEGASFVETFQAEHADRYLKALDQRREIAARMARMRRARFLGLFALVGAGLGVAAGSVLRRISRDLEDDRRWLRGDGPPP
ncbi:MAG TPA: hypothetical protein VMT17_08825 [Anaeromyxobacteraceae bacterium]|nr:hypothetical protein [Anaeromyxobacteraceae bacterium]